MTTQINIDHQTIRLLMKEDPAFEVKVKEAILRTAVKGMTKQALEEGTKDYIDRMIEEMCGTWKKATYPYNREFVPSVSLREALDSFAVNSFKKTITDTFQKTLDELNALVRDENKKLRRRINEYLTDKLTDEKIDRVSTSVIRDHIKDFTNKLWGK